MTERESLAAAIYAAAHMEGEFLLRSGAVVDAALCVIDRESGGAEKLATEGIARTALFRFSELAMAGGG